GLSSLLRAPRQLLVALKAEHLPQNLLAIRCALPGELVRAPLRDEGAVREGRVVHPHTAVDLGLRLPDCPARKGRLCAGISVDLERVNGAGASLWTLSDDPVLLPVCLEREVDERLPLANVDAVVLEPPPRLAPEGPRYRVQQRGFPLAVFPGQHG